MVTIQPFYPQCTYIDVEQVVYMNNHIVNGCERIKGTLIQSRSLTLLVWSWASPPGCGELRWGPTRCRSTWLSSPSSSSPTSSSLGHNRPLASQGPQPTCFQKQVGWGPWLLQYWLRPANSCSAETIGFMKVLSRQKLEKILVLCL